MVDLLDARKGIGNFSCMAEAECAFGAVDVERTQGTECEEQGLF